MEAIDLIDIMRELPIINQMSPQVRDVVLRLLLLIIALLIVWVLRRVLTYAVVTPVKQLTKRTSFETDNRILEAVRRPMRLVVLALGIAITTALLDFGPAIQAFADDVARALVIAAMMFAIYNLVDIIAISSDVLARVTGIQIEDRLLPFLRTVVKIFILVMGTLIILQEFGYDVTGLIASFGVVGLAFSLAAQDTAANVFGFTAIVSDNPFDIGDYIVTNDFAGIVEHVGVRSTRIRKLDQSVVYVPNSKLTDAPVTNWSRLSKRRIDFTLGLTYDTTSQQMREVMNRIRAMLGDRNTIDPDSVVVRFAEFGDSALNIKIIAMVLIADWNAWMAEVEEVNLAIMDIVQQMGLSIAFPSRSLYIETLPNIGSETTRTPSPMLDAQRTNRRIQHQQEPQGRDEAQQANETASNDAD